MTPERIVRIEVENELLREQVRIIRNNCSYYRELELEAEEEIDRSREMGCLTTRTRTRRGGTAPGVAC